MRRVSFIAVSATTLIFGVFFVLIVGLGWFIGFTVAAMPSSAAQFQPSLDNLARIHADTAQVHAATWIGAYIVLLLVLFIVVGCAYWLRARTRHNYQS